MNTSPRFKVLVACCGAHAMQDGLVALKFVLLPLLAQSFGLSYTQVGLLRTMSSAAMTLLEIPSGFLAERFGERKLLVFGLVLAGLGYLGIAMADSFFAIAVCFLLAGVGAAFQHSLSSAVLVAQFDGGGRRQALGTYNSSGDAGKLAFTGLFSLAIGAGLAWNAVVIFLAVATVVFGFAVWFLLRDRERSKTEGVAQTEELLVGVSRWGVKNSRRFAGLGALVFLDSMVQSVFLTFIAFVMLFKGAGAGLAASAVVLVLAGGMVGKFACGFLAARLGDCFALLLVQLLTVFGVIAAILLSVSWLLICLPVVGLVLQGSSTITYGSVADFIDERRHTRGYSLIYTLANGASIVGPLLFGFIADQAELLMAMWVLVGIVCLTLPLCFVMTRLVR